MKTNYKTKPSCTAKAVYEAPVIEIVILAADDVITTSGAFDSPDDTLIQKF